MTATYYSHPTISPDHDHWDVFLRHAENTIAPYRPRNGKWIVTTPRGQRRPITAYEISELFWKVLMDVNPSATFGVEVVAEDGVIHFHVALDRADYLTYRLEPTQLTNTQALATLYLYDGSIFDVQPANQRNFTATELIHLVGGPVDERIIGRQAIISVAQTCMGSRPINPVATARVHDMGLHCAMHGDVLVGEASLLENDQPVPHRWVPGLYLTAAHRYVRLVGRHGQDWIATTIHNDAGKFSPGHDHPLPTHLDWKLITDAAVIVRLVKCLYDHHLPTLSRLPVKERNPHVRQNW